MADERMCFYCGRPPVSEYNVPLTDSWSIPWLDALASNMMPDRTPITVNIVACGECAKAVTDYLLETRGIAPSRDLVVAECEHVNACSSESGEPMPDWVKETRLGEWVGTPGFVCPDCGFSSAAQETYAHNPDSPVYQAVKSAFEGTEALT